MAAYDTVGKIIDAARILLQDTRVGNYRYDDPSLILHLNDAVLEARRVRPDLFLPSFTLPAEYAAKTDPFTLEPMYRPAFVYYVAGKAQLRDDETGQDSRATVLLNKFIAQLTIMPA